MSNKKELTDLSDIPPLEGDKEEVKKGKRFNILAPNELLTRLQILLAILLFYCYYQIKVETIFTNKKMKSGKCFFRKIFYINYTKYLYCIWKN